MTTNGRAATSCVKAVANLDCGADTQCSGAACLTVRAWPVLTDTLRREGKRSMPEVSFF